MGNVSNIVAAFEMLLEEIEAEINKWEIVNQRAWENRDFIKARKAIEQAEAITTFREKVVNLQSEWIKLMPKDEVLEHGEDAISHTNKGRLKAGMRTPERAFYIPILKTLIKFGGQGTVNEVLDMVEKEMREQLKDIDYEHLPSSPEMIRWRNTAQWARASMVKEGLLKDNSPRGVWEISEFGEKYLKDNIKSFEE